MGLRGLFTHDLNFANYYVGIEEEHIFSSLQQISVGKKHVIRDRKEQDENPIKC